MQVLRSKPFQSEPLDRLAETMHTSKILNRSKCKRYYKARFLREGCCAYVDVIFFDTKYYDDLLPEELLAVGAHEFNHINNNHGIKRFMRIICPAIATTAIIGLLVVANYASINSALFFNTLEGSLFFTFALMLSLSLPYFASFYINAKWFQQQETQCDLSAVKFANGEALISALVKLNTLRPNKRKCSDSRFSLRLYPTLEQRTNNIRTAIESQKK